MVTKSKTPAITVTAKPVETISVFQKNALAHAGAIPFHGRLLTDGTITHVAGRPELDRRPADDKDRENFEKDGSRKERDEHKPQFSVELLCRTFAGDSGVRPLPNLMFWESPDIWIEGPSGDPDIATPGTINKVMVHIWNLGLADCWAAHVDLYWCDPAVGINAQSAQAIGSTVIDLAAGQHRIVEFDWTPVMANDGHECLVAQVYDPVSDPIVAPFNPVQDRHVAQRNVSVISLPAGQPLNYVFYTQNLSRSIAAVTLEVQRLEGEALEVLALSLGQKAWAVAGQKTVLLGQPAQADLMVGLHADWMETGLFRETLQNASPGTNERRRVGAALQMLVAPQARAVRKPAPVGKKPKKASAMPQPATLNVLADKTKGKTSLLAMHIGPRSRLSIAMEASLPKRVKKGSADVYRIVERTGDKITGGVTIVLRGK